MFNIKKDIQSLTDFKRNTVKLMKQLKKSGRPIVLTVNGKAELVVQDADVYQDILERLETVEALRIGLNQMKSGQTRSAQEVDSELRQKYDISN